MYPLWSCSKDMHKWKSESGPFPHGDHLITSCRRANSLCHFYSVRVLLLFHLCKYTTEQCCVCLVLLDIVCSEHHHLASVLIWYACNIQCNICCYTNCFNWGERRTHTTVLRLFGFCPGQPGWAGTRRNMHPLTPIVGIKYPYLLPPSTTIHDILRIQSTCFTVFFHNLSPSFLWSTSWPYTLHFILHTFLH